MVPDLFSGLSILVDPSPKKGERMALLGDLGSNALLVPIRTPEDPQLGELAAAVSVWYMERSPDPKIGPCKLGRTEVGSKPHPKPPSTCRPLPKESCGRVFFQGTPNKWCSFQLPHTTNQNSSQTKNTHLGQFQDCAKQGSFAGTRGVAAQSKQEVKDGWDAALSPHFP